MAKSKNNDTLKRLSNLRDLRRGENSDMRRSINPKLQKFFEEHGNFVSLENKVLFSDGATIDKYGVTFGNRHAPPNDLYERAKVVRQYWEAKAKRAGAEFYQFQNYLKGCGGNCPPDIFTEEDQLEHLQKLKDVAVDARGKLKKATEIVQEETPAWMNAKKRDDAAIAMQKSVFKEQVNSIRL